MSGKGDAHARVVEAKAKGGECAWAREGVWAWDNEQGKPVVLKEGYFSRFPSSHTPRAGSTGGREAEVKRDEVDFYKDFYWPFVRRWEGMVQRTAGEGKMLHVEAVPNQVCRFPCPDPLSWGNDIIYFFLVWGTAVLS
jgi:hypothetical protein